MSDLSVKQVCNKIWDIEEKYNLFNKKINDVYFWKLVRFSIFQKILKEKNIYGEAHTKASQKFIDKLLYLPRALKNTHLYGALKRNSQKDFLIFEHPRKVTVNGQYIDIYTHYFIEDNNFDSYEIIDSPYLRKHFNKPSKNRSYSDHFSIKDYFKRKLWPYNLDENELAFVSSLEDAIELEFDIEIGLIKDIEYRITHFKNEVKYYNKLLKKREPKKVFLLVSYGKEALIAACNKKNVPVIELQHGTINKYHLGYSFPNNDDIPYFPDQIYLFGQYWADSTPLPLEKDKLTNYGFPYLEKRIAEYKNYSKIDNQILFISQGTIGNGLAQIAYAFAKNNKYYNVVYKLHPGEYDRWQQDYKALNKAVKLDNFKVIDNNNINLYQLFAESEYQVGVYSTAIYEGLTLNCKTILLDLPGLEYMEYLIEADIVKFAENAEQLIDLIREDNFEQNYDKDYFFSGV